MTGQPMTLPVITVTLLGASHLVGFSGFSAQEVRRLRIDRAGHRVLAGPFHRQPTPGVPLPIRLKPSTRALLIRARAFDSANDLFLPLVHAPGESVRIPLLAPPPVASGSLLRLAHLFRAAPWTEAVTYRETFPHEYSRRSAWPTDEDFVFAARMIARHGYRAWFRGSTSAGWWTQLDLTLDRATFTFWTGFERPEQHRWINRRPLVDRPAVPQRVRQVLVADDARVVDVADARALALALFPEVGQ